ncbi:hypothetical protein SLEP1_g48617 [Rubroshorea leprosula]|uniref:Uncharacterized protein n=1 Tax=Rubroshorea leprosula TaxID=152421 RepID=A0AAV5LX81_9ROSI|nr:hypothetical protein SLEP1_g48617 [Rubroshorea leprosula]
MLKLCLMASYGYPPHQEQGFTRTIKEFPPSFQEARQGLIQSGVCNLRPNEYQDPWKPIAMSNQLQKFASSVGKPLVIDMQETCSHSVLFSSGIAEKCARHEKIVRFLTSGLSEGEKGGLDLSSLSNLMELHPSLQPLLLDVHQPELASSLIYPSVRVDNDKLLLDFIGDMVCKSKLTVSPDGRVLVTGCGTEMKDILSIVGEFYLSKNSSMSSKQPMLVPYFDRPKSRKARAALSLSSQKLDTVTVAPTKSPEKTKMKPSAKKKTSKKVGKERDLYKKNFSHACESLLSLMMNKRLDGKMALLSIRKSGGELPELLNQFSACIAGTGLAVLFSIICKVACGRVSICSSKLFSTALGFGLVWLSWAVNRLRDTVVCISKNAGK